MSARALALIGTLAIAGACRPTAPSCTDQFGRGATQLNALDVSCSAGASDLQCEAVASIKDLYVYCPMQETVTQSAVWSVGDPNVVSVAAPGIFQAVGPGDTFVRATWQGLASVMRPVSVFAGAPPLPTQEIFGAVYRKGQTPAAGAVNGAVVEVLDGVAAGRSAISGVPPPLLPGYLGPFGGPGYYRLLGIPPGTFRVRITRDGYASQERVVVVTDRGSPSASFELEPL
jgi:hypothetical protein